MKIIGFIERRQHEVIERISRHCGLREGPIRTLADSRAPPDKGSSQYSDEPRELQLVLEPEYLKVLVALLSGTARWVDVLRTLAPISVHCPRAKARNQRKTSARSSGVLQMPILA